MTVFPAPAVTPADFFVRAVSVGVFTAEQVPYIAKAVDKIAAGWKVRGLAMLADVPGYLGTNATRAIREIVGASGMAPALDAARRVIDGDDGGIDHVWMPVQSFGSASRVLWRCESCGVETYETRDSEGGCPAGAIRAALRANREEWEG